MSLGLGSSWHIFPCFEHAPHTVSFAPSIIASMGLPLILRPQTSHRKGLCTCGVFIYASCVYSCRIMLAGACVESVLTRIRSVADYQFGRGVGAALFPESVEVAFSRRTGRIRYVFLGGKRLATMRPTDGLFSLSLAGACLVVGHVRCVIVVRDNVARFVAEGGDVFAVHVVSVNDEVRARDEVVVVDGAGRVLAVGRAVLSGAEMRAFKRGVAVKVRRGVES